MSVKMRQEVERKIVEAVIDRALEAGFTIDVNDGESTTLKNSVDKASILAAMFTTDEDYLYMNAPKVNPTHLRDGWVFFVYGNDGWDVVNDYTTNLEPIMDRANALADEYSD